MRTRSFGTTDLRCSEIGFGTWALGSNWWGTVTSGEGVNLIRRAIDLGITFFDTGDVYGKGANEEIVGQRARRACRASRVQLSTKFGYALEEGRQEHSQGERPQDWSPAHARSGARGEPAAARHRLRRPLPAAQPAHGRDRARRPVRGARAAARRGQAAPLRRRARARRSAGATRACARSRSATSTSLQTVYNVLEQQPGRDFLEAAERKGAGVMARVPTSSGLLEDKYTLETTFPQHDHRSHRPREWLVEGLQKVERLRFLSEEHGFTMAQAALKFILAQDAIACVLPTVVERRGPRGVGGRLGRARPHRRGPRRGSRRSTSATSTSSPSLRAPRDAASRAPRAAEVVVLRAPQDRHQVVDVLEGHVAQRDPNSFIGVDVLGGPELRMPATGTVVIQEVPVQTADQEVEVAPVAPLEAVQLLSRPGQGIGDVLSGVLTRRRDES